MLTASIKITNFTLNNDKRYEETSETVMKIDGQRLAFNEEIPGPLSYTDHSSIDKGITFGQRTTAQNSERWIPVLDYQV